MSNASAHRQLPEARDASYPHDLAGRSAVARAEPIVTLARLLVASDMLALGLAFFVSHVLASTDVGHAASEPGGLGFLAAAFPAWLVGVSLSSLCSGSTRLASHPAAKESVDLGHLAVIGTGLFLLVALATRIEHGARDELVDFAMLAVTFVTAGRVGTRALLGRHDGHAQTAVIVGAGAVGQLVARKLLRHPEYGIELVGFVDAPPRQWRRDVVGVPVLGEIDELATIVRELAVDRVIVAFARQKDEEMLALVRPLLGQNVHVDVVPRMFEMVGPHAEILGVEGIPLVSVSPRARSAVASRVKRGIDIVGACIGLFLAAPLFLWAAWRIPRESPGPVFYRQTRLGTNMQGFTMLKFRTMTVDADQSAHHAYVERAMSAEQIAAVGELYKLDRRDVVTPTGRWLRRTSLDELPQLINVLRGNMSLVGPRPCLAYETEYFAAHHFERFLVSPGITGLWQVTARAHAGFAEALEMDVLYVRDWSLALDLSLILRTPVELLRQRKATV
jgi:exopolysaccharide biosynthesis polyprenyl glycosylphosphotransferase